MKLHAMKARVSRRAGYLTQGDNFFQFFKYYLNKKESIVPNDCRNVIRQHPSCISNISNIHVQNHTVMLTYT